MPHVPGGAGRGTVAAMSSSSADSRKRDNPSPEDPRKPDSPTDMGTSPWKHALKGTLSKFSADECTDLAAALTYYAVLALFPALIALLSLVGVFGQGPKSVDSIAKIISDTAGSSAAKTVEPILTSLSTGPGAGFALIIGLVAALWSASGYVNAFARAMNRVYQIGEGRPVWKLRPVMLLITLLLVVLTAVVLLMLVVSGPVATSVGSSLGLGSTLVLVWQIAKWPVLLIVVVVIVAVLYRFTPNVKTPKFKWISIGALFAIVVWILASAAFGFYVATFSSYSKTYGSFASIVVFLLWLWITNVALLFGAELDAELERSRQLQAGIEAEDEIQLPPRDTTNIEKTEKKKQDHVEEGRDIRTRRSS